MYSRKENWFQNALSKSSAEEYKSKGIPKTVWSQSWGCFLSVLASMVLSHQHGLRNDSLALENVTINGPTVQPTIYVANKLFLKCTQRNKSFFANASLSYLAVLSHRLFFWKNALCNVKGVHHIMYENAIAYKHTPTLLLFSPLTVWQFLAGFITWI